MYGRLGSCFSATDLILFSTGAIHTVLAKHNYELEGLIQIRN
jgi:hypothetical protein